MAAAVEITLKREDIKIESSTRYLNVLDPKIPRDVVAQAILDLIYTPPPSSATFKFFPDRFITHQRAKDWKGKEEDRWEVSSPGKELNDPPVRLGVVSSRTDSDLYVVNFYDGQYADLMCSTRAREFERQVEEGELDRLIHEKLRSSKG